MRIEPLRCIGVAESQQPRQPDPQWPCRTCRNKSDDPPTIQTALTWAEKRQEWVCPNFKEQP